MTQQMSRVFMVCMVVILAACSSTKPFYNFDVRDWAEKSADDAGLVKTVYMIGDAGNPQITPLEPSLALLQRKLAQSDQANTSVVFLGDNIYDLGLHKKDHPDRAQDELRIATQMDVLEDFSGNAVFIPGNHDWKQGKPKGDEYVQRQERFIEKYLDRGNTFLPDNGCPGPEEILLDEKLLLVVIDTQWWLHEHNKPEGDNDKCDVEDAGAFLLQLEDIFRKNRDKQVVVVGHHPLYSNGNHGGYYTFKDHLFPLTALNKNLYIPLPILGSIYPLYRGLMGDIQDIPHYKYQALITSLTDIFEENDDVVYVSGHEHNLQYLQPHKTHYIVSGAGSKQSYVRRNSDLTFGQETKGFAALKYYENGDLWVEYYAPSAENVDGELVFKHRLRTGAHIHTLPEKATHTITNTDSLVTVVPGGKYYRPTKFKNLVMGNLYRTTWVAPIDVPVIDLSVEHGGMHPVRRGGGMQSRSLRLKADDGHQYVLRSIQKFPASVIPVEIRNTFVSAILQDGIAASHPYAALTVPTMAQAAGVYYTQPKLVFVPDDPILGEYRSEFGNLLCLYEERPTGNMSEFDNFGNSKKIIGTPDLIDKLAEDHHNSVDQISLLRARLFDAVIGDWDRHDDQWRWASFKNGKGHIYKPIPRDRDQVFYKMDGIVPYFVDKPWAARLFEPFDEEVKDYTSLNFNARHLDRAYLTEPSREDWQAMADSLQAALTDEVFSQALSLFPDSVKKFENDRLMHNLQSRRDHLNEIADTYYLILAKEVDIVGSERDEYFEIKRLDDDQTEVTVYPIRKKKGKSEKVLYHRIFKTDETKEIRIYGLDGNDTYHLSGHVKKGIMVRLIGGSEVDTYIDSSHVRGLKKHTQIFDRKKKKRKNQDIYVLERGARKIESHKSEDAVIYERKAFVYDLTKPIAYLGYNPDDGVYLGAGIDIKKYGFNKAPFKYSHNIKGNYAFETGAFNFKYKTIYNKIFFSKWNFEGAVDVAAPDYQFNFYGLGNETNPINDNEDNNRLRVNFFNVSTLLKRSSKGEVHTLSLGPKFLYVNPPFENFSGNEDIPVDFLDELDFNDRWYAGFTVGYALNNIDNEINPHRGVRFSADAEWINGFENTEANFVRLKSEFKVYLPFNLLPTKSTLAIRSGVQSNFGDFDFYQANFLGGYQELRGLRRNRFGGDVAFYNNLDLRIRLFDLDNYVLPIEIGVLGFGDIGRVWAENDTSKLWHWGAGAGLYLSPLNFIVVNMSYAFSDVDEVFTFGMGFLF